MAEEYFNKEYVSNENYYAFCGYLIKTALVDYKAGKKGYLKRKRVSKSHTEEGQYYTRYIQAKRFLESDWFEYWALGELDGPTLMSYLDREIDEEIQENKKSRRIRKNEF